MLYSNHVRTGDMAMERGDAKGALAEYDEAVQLDPKGAEAHTGRGGALHRLGRSEEALAALGRTVRLSPDDPIPRIIRGRALVRAALRRAARRGRRRLSRTRRGEGRRGRGAAARGRRTAIASRPGRPLPAARRPLPARRSAARRPHCINQARTGPHAWAGQPAAATAATGGRTPQGPKIPTYTKAL